MLHALARDELGEALIITDGHRLVVGAVMQLEGCADIPELRLAWRGAASNAWRTHAAAGRARGAELVRPGARDCRAHPRAHAVPVKRDAAHVDVAELAEELVRHLR